MDLFKLGIAGAAAYLIFGKNRNAEEIISSNASDIAQGEVIATSGNGEQVVIATCECELADTLEITDPVTGQTDTYVKDGNGVVDEHPNGNATYTPTEETAMNGTFFSSETFLGRESAQERMGQTIYSNPAPLLYNPVNSKGNPKSRDLRRRFAVIGRRLPTYDACSAAGKKVAKWRWGKNTGRYNGKTLAQDATPSRRLSNQAAILASTPCEVFSKVSHGEMTAGAAERRLRGYYSRHKDTEGLEHVVNSWK